MVNIIAMVSLSNYAHSVDLEHRADGIYFGTIPESIDLATHELIIEVECSSLYPRDLVLSNFAKYTKVSIWEHLVDVMMGSLEGVQLHPAALIPVTVHTPPHVVYFTLIKSGMIWEEIQRVRNIAVVPRVTGGLRYPANILLRLWARFPVRSGS